MKYLFQILGGVFIIPVFTFLACVLIGLFLNWYAGFAPDAFASVGVTGELANVGSALAIIASLFFDVIWIAACVDEDFDVLGMYKKA